MAVSMDRRFGNRCKYEHTTPNTNSYTDDYYGAPQRSNDYGYNQNNNRVWQQGGGHDRGNWNSGQDRYSRDLSSNRNNSNDRYTYRGDVDYRDAQRYTRTDVDSRPRQADQDLTIAPEDLLQMISQEMSNWSVDKIWPFSCFGYSKHIRNIPGLDDLSFEEVRLNAYDANLSQNANSYMSWFTDLIREYESKRKRLVHPDPQEKLILLDFIKESNDLAAADQISKPFPDSVPFSFTSSAHGNAFTSNSAFGSSGFGSGSGSTGFSAPSNFGSTGSSAPQAFGSAGASSAPAFGSTSAFGAPAFGAPAGAFGAPAGAFGAPAGATGAPASAFGAPAGAFGTPAGAFGTPAGAFGTPAGAFGTPAGAFGTSAGAFGTPVSAISFGSTTTPSYPTSTQASGFLSTQPPAFPPSTSTPTQGNQPTNVATSAGRPQLSQQSSTIHTPMDDLSVEDKSEFAADRFTYIPRVPPAVEFVR